MQLHFAKILPN